MPRTRDTPEMIDAYQMIREAGKAFAEVIERITPPSAGQTEAILKIREAVFAANAAIAGVGK
jgi:hypothetical protein